MNYSRSHARGNIQMAMSSLSDFQQYQKRHCSPAMSSSASELPTQSVCRSSSHLPAEGVHNSEVRPAQLVHKFPTDQRPVLNSEH